MLTAALIAFREFFEVFLVVGVFLGISRKLKTGMEFGIVAASIAGILVSFLLAIAVFVYGGRVGVFFREDNAELFENLVLVFSGFFLAYAITSLHNFLRKGRGVNIAAAHRQIRNHSFDLPLFFTIFLLVIREGFEIALFTASASLVTDFVQNLTGLIVGFVSAGLVGWLVFLVSNKVRAGSVLKLTEYAIILLGASFVQNGVGGLLEYFFNLDLSGILALPLSFLPAKDTVAGHLVATFTGVDREFSIARLVIMVLYITVIYRFFLKKSGQNIYLQ